MFHRTRSVLMASVILVLGFSSFAVARTGDPLREGQRNGTATKETSIVANVAAGTGRTGGYSTRQSNTSTTGGGAIYGCRSNGTATSNPCVRANNLSAGKAFEFNAASGPVGGTITLGTGGDSKKPFTTNATGVADGLNADRVDGQNADQIIAAARAGMSTDASTVGGSTAGQLRTRWVLVNANGDIEAQSGGFSIIAKYPGAEQNPQPPAAGNVYIDSGENLTDNGIVATIGLQNGDDQPPLGEAGAPNQAGADPDPDSNPEFSGEISASRGQVPTVATPTIVNCGPNNAKNLNAFVISPRNSDGTRTTGNDDRKRFYVTITE